MNQIFLQYSTIIVKEYVKELEEIPEIFEQNTSSEMITNVGESSGSNFQDDIFNMLEQEQPNFLSLFKCSLTHIITREEAFRERKKVFHSLFPYPCSLNYLVQLPIQSKLSNIGVKIIEVLQENTLNIK